MLSWLAHSLHSNASLLLHILFSPLRAAARVEQYPGARHILSFLLFCAGIHAFITALGRSLQQHTPPIPSFLEKTEAYIIFLTLPFTTLAAFRLYQKWLPQAPPKLKSGIVLSTTAYASSTALICMGALLDVFPITYNFSASLLQLPRLNDWVPVVLASLMFFPICRFAYYRYADFAPAFDDQENDAVLKWFLWSHTFGLILALAFAIVFQWIIGIIN